MGILFGIGLVVFGILFSGCNHKSKNKAAIFYIDQDPIWEEVEDMDTTPAPPAGPVVVDIDIEDGDPCKDWPPHHEHGHGHGHDGHDD